MDNDVFGFLNEIPVDEVTLSPADESAIFLAALQDMCTPEEYNELVMENATELELYGLIDNASIVTEAKKIVYKQTKQMNLNREQAKAAIQMSKNANDPLYKKYHKGRSMMVEARDDIYKKYQAKARSEAKRIVSNSKRKAASMNSAVGSRIEQKMEKKISDVRSGKKIGAGVAA